MEEKNGFPWPENQFSTCKNKLFLRLFTPNSNMVSTGSKIAPTKKYFSAKQKIRLH